MQNNSKLKKILKIIFIILAVICLLIGGLYLYYKSHIDVAIEHENEYDYDLNINHNLPSYKINDLIEYNNDLSTNLLISIPKDLFYKEIINIDSINTSIRNEYNFNINKIGIRSDDNNPNELIIVLDLSFINNPNFNTFAYLYLNCELNEDNLIVYFKDLIVGKDLPRFIYKNYIPYTDNEIMYKLNTNELDVFDGQKLNLSNIKNIKINKDIISFEADIINTIKDFVRDNFNINSDKLDAFIEALLPTLMDLILND